MEAAFAAELIRRRERSKELCFLEVLGGKY